MQGVYLVESRQLTALMGHSRGIGQTRAIPSRSHRYDSHNPCSRCRLWLMRLIAMISFRCSCWVALNSGSAWEDTAMTPVFFRRIQINGHNFMCRMRIQLPVFSAGSRPHSAARSICRGESRPLASDFLVWRIRRHWRPRSNLWRWPIFEVLLRERYPGTDFQVVCVAMTAIDSSTILPIARECARHQGDLWLIYMGNNEMVGPSGRDELWITRAQSGRDPDHSRRQDHANRTITDNLIGRLRSNSSTLKKWGGMGMFMNCPHWI